MPAETLFRDARTRLETALPARLTGRVAQIIGLVVECEGLSVPLGAACAIAASGGPPVPAEVVGFRDQRVLLMPLGELSGIRRFDPVHCTATAQTVGVGPELLGRVIDARGRPVDGGPLLVASARRPLAASPPPAMERPRIAEPLATGVRAIDGLLTCGRGQRVGLFSGSGVGKSVLLGMICRYTSADINVVALVGERGREVRDFIEKDLGPEALRRTVVVVATSDQPALLRVKAPFTATAVAEYFRDQGKNVLLLMDSVTRMAIAQREIGLSAGEPPATKGYPPSVFALLPRLLERSGLSARGSITGIYSVLVEADDLNEPIADAARSILDGHLWLSRDLAHRGHYPAIDPLASVSRLMIDVASPEHREAAAKIRAALAVYRQNEDPIHYGVYVAGRNPEIDAAIRLMPKANAFLRQAIEEGAPYRETVRALIALAADPPPAAGTDEAAKDARGAKETTAGAGG
jgi:flagellum-specific ATP synthase